MEPATIAEYHYGDGSSGQHEATLVRQYELSADGLQCLVQESPSMASPPSESYHWAGIVSSSVQSIICDTFLPVGYPHTVRPEYLTYQLWDSLQGLCSYLRSVLTTKSVLAATGVGSTESTPMAAALTWVLRDGIGMIGSLVFAYTYAEGFEVYVKEWRFFADILNNIGLTIDLISSHFPSYFLLLTSISTVCKACCGLVAGATKVRISAHFAAAGHLADVSAKESTQETAVALTGMMLGMLLAHIVADDENSIWITFLILLAIHQISNYYLVRVLVLDTLNPQRVQILTTAALNGLKDDHKNSIVFMLSPAEVAAEESFIVPVLLYWKGPIVGARLQLLAESIDDVNESLKVRVSKKAEYKTGGAVFALLKMYCGTEDFIVGLSNSTASRTVRVIICMKNSCSAQSIVRAYFVAFFIHHMLPMMYRNSLLDAYDELLRNGQRNEAKECLLLQALMWCTQVMKSEDMERLWIPNGVKDGTLQQIVSPLLVSCGKWRISINEYGKDKIS